MHAVSNAEAWHRITYSPYCITVYEFLYRSFVTTELARTSLPRSSRLISTSIKFRLLCGYLVVTTCEVGDICATCIHAYTDCDRGFVSEPWQASNSSTYQNIRAHGGDLDIRFTKIVSWDLLAADYDFDTSDGRRCVCVCACSGVLR